MNRSLLFIPGNSPKMMLNSNYLGADAVIFDLEDAVAPLEKDAARILVRRGLGSLPLGDVDVIVRVNAQDTPYWQRDLDAIVPARPNAVILPKASDARQIAAVSAYVDQLEGELGPTETGIQIFPLIETALGVENAFEIGKASPRVAALLLGGEDLTADLRCKRTLAGEEIRYARGRLVCAARAAGIEAYDTPFTSVSDLVELRRDAEYARGLGFTGKLAIHPGHVNIINQVFSPSEAEYAHAEAVLAALRLSEEKGSGVAVVDGKMVDAPVVKRAVQILEMKQRYCGRL